MTSYMITHLEMECQRWDDEEGATGDSWFCPCNYQHGICNSLEALDEQLSYLFGLPPLTEWSESEDNPGWYSWGRVESAEDREQPGAEILVDYSIRVVSFSDPEPLVLSDLYAEEGSAA